jgi:cation:H+ antiporter
MVLSIVGIVAGLALLTYASDQFVVGAARVAKALRLSPILIGAVVIGFGTSAPEMLVSGLAGAQGSLDIGVGNIIGSNVANLTLVLGIAALVTPIVVRSTVLKREAPIALGATLVFAVVVQGGLAGGEAAILAVVLALGLALIIRGARRGDDTLTAEVDEFLTGEVSLGREWTRTLLGLLVTLGAAQILVVSATTIARELGLEEGFVGLTIVAIGTSLPELAASIVAVARGERDLAVGNIVGSNVFNIGLVLGLTALASPEGISVTADATAFHLPILLATALVLLPVTLTKMTVSRLEGALFVGFYTAYIGYLVLESFGYVKTGPLGLMMLGFVVPMTAMWLVLLVINEWDTLRHRGSGLFGSERTARAVRRHARSD